MHNSKKYCCAFFGRWSWNLVPYTFSWFSLHAYPATFFCREWFWVYILTFEMSGIVNLGANCYTSAVLQLIASHSFCAQIFYNHVKSGHCQGNVLIFFPTGKNLRNKYSEQIPALLKVITKNLHYKYSRYVFAAKRLQELYVLY